MSNLINKAIVWVVPLAFLATSYANAESPVAGPPSVHPIWPESPPAWNPPTDPEGDTTGADGRLVSGKPVVRLGNVRVPQLHIYPAAPEQDTGTAVIICPGGGYSILAWDLEGTEIATWLQGLGVTAAVLKYRVPTRNNEPMWLAPVQDIQRSIALLRSGTITAEPPEQVGVLGFSAGGNAAARVITAEKRFYDSVDAADQDLPRPDFGVLVYPAWLVSEADPTKLIDELPVTDTTPPVFFAHARDDRISCLSSVAMFAALQRYDIPAELHVFADGGHGFGARPSETAVDRWPSLCESWMRNQEWLNP